jgi:hypothetical protein
MRHFSFRYKQHSVSLLSLEYISIKILSSFSQLDFYVINYDQENRKYDQYYFVLH